MKSKLNSQQPCPYCPDKECMHNLIQFIDENCSAELRYCPNCGRKWRNEMREILFRGFCPNENGKQTITLDGEDIRGDWKEGYYIKHLPYTPSVSNNDIKAEKDTYHLIAYDGLSDCDMPRNLYVANVIPESVGQYTGLKDIRGKRIFEGDILQASLGGDLRIDRVYCEDAQWFGARTLLIYAVAYGGAEVVGNIYDKEK